MPTKKKGFFLYVAVVIVMLFICFYGFTKLYEATAIDYKYSDIVFLFQDNKVSDYELDLGTGELTVVLKEGENFEGAKENSDGQMVFTCKVKSVSLFLDDIKGFVNEYNAKADTADRIGTDYEYTKSNTLLASWLPTILLIAAMIGLFVFMTKQTGGGKITQFGKANMKNPAQHGIKTTFADVAGADEEKEELQEIVGFLKSPKKYKELGARIPKGVLLVGPPGTGKTLLARAVAGEAGAPFFSISGSDFVEMFVGVGASRVRDLFEQAKKHAPSIIFIDEIDAVGRHRGAGLGGGHDEREQTLNQLLVEMDGFGENQGVIVIAATNRRDILDPALLRPGRFDRQVVVGYPDVKGREEILKVHAKNKPLGFDVDLKVIARSTAGFTGADLENILNEAALLAARRDKKAITATEIEEATIKVVAGPEKRSHKIHEVDKKITAYHEAGHAVVSFYLPTQDPVHEISIIPRGMAAGYTLNLPEDDRAHMSKTKMEENLALLLGGRVAETVALDDVCTGASNDIERATKLARSMVTKYGFSSKLGAVMYGEAEGEVFLGKDMGHQRNYSEAVAAQIDDEIRTLIDNAFNKAKEILLAHMDKLDLVAKYLIVYEKISADTFKDLMEGKISIQSVEAELKSINENALIKDETASDNNGAEAKAYEVTLGESDKSLEADDHSSDEQVTDDKENPEKNKTE